jgi:hypothetical protein
MTHVLALGAVLAQATALSAMERLYLQACAAGIGAAIEVLPDVPNRDEFHSRGLASCQGSRTRLAASGELAKERNVVEFACGYAVGAMFAKYGLGSEVQPKMSERAVKAFKACTEQWRYKGPRAGTPSKARDPRSSLQRPPERRS